MLLEKVAIQPAQRQQPTSIMSEMFYILKIGLCLELPNILLSRGFHRLSLFHHLDHHGCEGAGDICCSVNKG